MASETGVLDVPPEKVLLQAPHPARAACSSSTPKSGRLIEDAEIKRELASRKPYGAVARPTTASSWSELPEPELVHELRDHGHVCSSGSRPSATPGRHRHDCSSRWPRPAPSPVGSMGNDTPLAVLSDQNPLLFHYFRQLFAQVSQPAAGRHARRAGHLAGDASSAPSSNLFEETPEHCHQLKLKEAVPDQPRAGEDARASTSAGLHARDASRPCSSRRRPRRHEGGPGPPLRRGLAARSRTA